MSLFSRFTNVFRGRHIDRDIEEELRSHFDAAQAEGRDPAEAQRAFGSRLRAHEAVRDVMVTAWLESLLADSHFGLRQLWKNKTIAAAAILSLGLGLGACMAAFRLIDALLLRPLPVSDPGSLYVLGSVQSEGGETMIQDSFNYPGFRILREAVRDQAAMMAIAIPQRINLTYSSDEAMERVYLQHVSGSMFTEFGLRPALGRLFTESDDLTPGAHPYAVLSHDYWARRFGTDPEVLGQTFRTGGVIYEVIGVAPEGFTGTEPGTFTDVFFPSMMYNAGAFENPNWQWFKPWVRVRPGTSVEEVHERLRAAMLVHRQQRAKGRGPGAGTQRELEAYLSGPIVLSPASAGASFLQRTYGRSLVIIGFLVLTVLLIACANVANLMTAQAAARAREMALRVSIGAGRARLIQLVLVESAWIAFAASAFGIMFAWWAAPFVVGMINPVDAPVRLALPTDGRVALFASLLTLAVTILFGLTPALRASGVKPASALKGGDDVRSRQRVMNSLVAAQVAFCVVVLLVAGLFVSTFDRLANRPLGFSPARVITLESVSRTGQSPDLWYQVADHLRELPEVENASLATFALMSGGGWNGNVWANGRTSEGNSAPWFLGVSPGWFETMKVPLLEGRQFRADDAFPSVAIVNQTFARRYFDGQSPVGKTLETIQGDKRVATRIVGLVADARYAGVRGPIAATVYEPFRNVTPQGTPQLETLATFNVRTRNANPLALGALLREEVKRARPEIRAANIRTQDELVRAQTIRERLLATLSVFFGVLALVLAGVGLYGVLNYAVTQRQRELGIRIALGAGGKDIARRVTAPVLVMIALGVGTGLALGISMATFLDSLLFEVKATDSSMLAWAACAIMSAAALAALPVVVRAVRIDPAKLLRTE